MTWAERWLKRKEKARDRKLHLRSSRPKREFSPTWEYVPSPDEPEVERDPFVPTDSPDSWFQFCVERKQAYEDRGEPIAAMVYWTMRYIDECEIGSDKDPSTAEGYQDLSEYWDYKVDGYERREATSRV